MFLRRFRGEYNFGWFCCKCGGVGSWGDEVEGGMSCLILKLKFGG